MIWIPPTAPASSGSSTLYVGSTRTHAHMHHVHPSYSGYFCTCNSGHLWVWVGCIGARRQRCFGLDVWFAPSSAKFLTHVVTRNMRVNAKVLTYIYLWMHRMHLHHATEQCPIVETDSSLGSEIHLIFCFGTAVGGVAILLLLCCVTCCIYPTERWMLIWVRWFPDDADRTLKTLKQCALYENYRTHKLLWMFFGAKSLLPCTYAWRQTCFAESGYFFERR